MTVLDLPQLQIPIKYEHQSSILNAIMLMLLHAAVVGRLCHI